MGKLPNASARVLPLNISPSTVAEQSSFIGIGVVIFIFQVIVLPSVHSSWVPSEPALLAIQLSPSILAGLTDFLSPSGDFAKHASSYEISCDVGVRVFYQGADNVIQGTIHTWSLGCKKGSSFRIKTLPWAKNGPWQVALCSEVRGRRCWTKF